MIAILTSSLGGSEIVDGKRAPTCLLSDNGLTDKIKSYWKKDSKVLIICAGPEEFEQNDGMLYCFKEAFAMSGLKAASFEMCDDRNAEIAENLKEYDVVLLAGGHVPTQNRFFHKIQLKKRLADFDGLILALSAGSMNSADTVYAQPELEGEAVDPQYERFLSGLGLTKCMMIPHFQSVRTDILDGFRVIEDITFADSVGREFIALNDGSFIISENGVETLYGEAYLIKDGKQIQICKDGDMYVICGDISCQEKKGESDEENCQYILGVCSVDGDCTSDDSFE
ncbi:MAG: Type 1 glutamine amidotransferase-like domain-containing protein [Roseburia sp.]